MKINKKAIIGMVAGLFAVATVFNMSMLNENGVGDVSLDAISIMAQAQIEGEDGAETRNDYDVTTISKSKITKDNGEELECTLTTREWGTDCYGTGSVECQPSSNFEVISEECC